jgi:hypothetical protein
MEKGTSPTIIFRHLCFASLRLTLSWYQRRPIQPPDHIRAQGVRLFTERRADRSRLHVISYIYQFRGRDLCGVFYAIRFCPVKFVSLFLRPVKFVSCYCRFILHSFSVLQFVSVLQVRFHGIRAGCRSSLCPAC